MTLALYRAYRPGTLAEVVGQDHVTAPLRRALASGRIHHAYLFSGPRGCGKTSTARILARSLNCEQGPTPDPCGSCVSCVALAPNGPGSEDVIELDAASHGGVDDTRELRERVIYSPASSRYRVYIIDEAHMVTTQGFNALLKVIEEPPEYVRFIFATTEPEKVLGTIRSRTFNYSFRLVSESVLSEHLASVCRSESVPFDRAAMPLIANSGGGSVRDALSVLGQLIAGSGDDGLTFDYVTGGLGLTDTALLDSVVAAVAARDGAGAFAAVDAVVESGHDGRRFLTDLLARMRDLIVLQHVPAADQASLLHLPVDQVEALRVQASLFGPAELSRAADLVSAGLSELKGATAPRLQLELLLARLLLPAADDGAAGFAARLDRVERAIATGAVHAVHAEPQRAEPQRVEPKRAEPQRAEPQRAEPKRVEPKGAEPATDPEPAAPTAARAASQAPASATASRETAAPASRPGRRANVPPRLSDLAPASAAGGAPATPPQDARPAGPRQEGGAPPARGAGAAQRGTSRPATGTPPAASRGAEDASRIVAEGWHAVLSELGKRSRVAWALWDGSRPVSVSDAVVTVAVADKGRLASIKASRRDELLRQVIIDVLRLDLAIAAEFTEPSPVALADEGAASPDDPDLHQGGESGVDLVIRELGAVHIGEIGDS